MASFLKRLFGRGDGSAQATAPGLGLSHQDTMERARNELALKSSVHDSGWGLGSAAWEVDLSAGVIAFTAKDGRRITAPVQVVGTLDTVKGSWMWGWDHPSVPEPVGRDATRVRDYGAKAGLAQLTTRVIACDEATAWDFAALAAHLSGAQGAYRGPAGPTLVFMTFGTVTMSRPAGEPAAPRKEKDFGEGLEPVEAPEAIDLVKRYCAEICAIETAHAALPEDAQSAAFGKAIDDQIEVYDRYWRRDDDYWKPCSVGSPSEFEPDAMIEWRVFARGPNRWRVAYVLERGIRFPRAFDVERFPDGLKIVDQLF